MSSESDSFDRVRLERPAHLPDHHWLAIDTEIRRLRRSLATDDGPQALSDIKCLVESIARVVLDIDGTPAASSEAFNSIVGQAHSRLKGQPGPELANDTAFGDLATQASKIARQLGNIRNEFGGGHGRARVPSFSDEMVVLALDGGLLWARWALRRLGYFSEGRPEALIDALMGSAQTFRAGDLRRRLLAARLPHLESRYQRSIGIAVGQRAARQTFVVHWDGVEPCLSSDDLATWPRDYRVGVAYGLWFDPDGNVTLTPESAREALLVLDPVADCSADLTDWVSRIVMARAGISYERTMSAYEISEFIRDRTASRPPEERAALVSLADVINPPLF
ncbi:abortive infection family protein [Mycolicibacterium tusciae]|uniref:Abortive infection protein-like C-terminal domain-containing protein n=1 Tax=Mycolicibacterium tusciae TaxID=75922 RepID=A0A1X0K261_9MYCO|nr:abortive infection family protein [Mycolicibacterium tusciae]ORB68566.1 hypothetical protein BST47_01220 [Mycolicibacterium tusciae]